MLFSSLLLILLSNAVTSRRDKSILYNRISITLLFITFIVALQALNLKFLAKGIGLYGGLFQTTATSHTFQMFIYILSAAIMQLTGFYPRKV